MSGHRKAALALHALAPKDRALILADLPAADQRVLRDYLDELAGLGFDAATVDAVLADRPAATPRERVAAAAAPDILRVLANEPLSVVQALLQAGPWLWEPALLAALPGHLRVRLETARGSGPASAPARAAFVVGAVADALLANGATPPAPPPRFGGLRNWIFPWRR